MGTAGRPGGPDFYISTVNNVRNHGPGGQGAYDLPEEADACFAHVVTTGTDSINSIDVVKRMMKAPVKPGGFREMEQYIEIKSARILPPNSI